MGFETQLPLLMDVGVALWGMAVLMGAWDIGAAPATAGGSVSPISLVGTAGESVGLSW